LSSIGHGTSPIPSEFLELARQTAKCSQQEVYLRSAISRAYFANHVLAVARAAQKFKGFEAGGTGDDHARVINAFKVGKTSQIANLLTSLRRRRNHADYHIEVAAEGCKFCRDGSVAVAEPDWIECLVEAERCFARLLAL
jgi:hypothetical protein